MEIEFPPELLKNIEDASKELNLGERELIVRAIKSYLFGLKKQISFEEEMEAWELASEKDISNWNKENLKNE